jgi:osmoprotectant transport system ATP-binding protein
VIRLENVVKRYPGGVEAVADLSLAVADGETLVLLGTSGSGKTTTMKMINRLIEPTSGRILVEGADVARLDPIALRRKIGYAIQHIGLFPHMTVAENVAVVPRLLRWTRPEIADRVDRLLAMVELDPGQFRDRYPAQLSGGQRQRVGVARALAADPPIVLMDEPFGALDPITREQLQNEFLELESEIHKTVVFVTHDVFEAVKVGDRIALLDQGRLQQLAAPAELVERPANEFVDRFLGQQRFQLALVTRTIQSILPEATGRVAPPEEAPPEEPGPGTSLRARDSLVAGLDLFKKTGAEVLPVRRRGRLVAKLSKRQLLQEISKALGETGAQE